MYNILAWFTGEYLWCQARVLDKKKKKVKFIYKPAGKTTGNSRRPILGKGTTQDFSGEVSVVSRQPLVMLLRLTQEEPVGWFKKSTTTTTTDFILTWMNGTVVPQGTARLTLWGNFRRSFSCGWATLNVASCASVTNAWPQETIPTWRKRRRKLK